MSLINATPHQLDIRLADGSMLKLPQGRVVCPDCGGDGWAADCRACGGIGTVMALVRVSETREQAGTLPVDCAACTEARAAFAGCCERHSGMATELPAIPFSRVAYGAVEGLAALNLRSGDVLVVSAIAAQRIAAELARVMDEFAQCRGGCTCGEDGAEEYAAHNAAYRAARPIPAGVILCCPGPAIRDGAGRQIGCDGLTVVHRT